MKWLRSIIGYFFAGTFVFSIWGGVLTADLGHFGGIIAGMLIIGPMWFLNHSLNLVGHGPNSGFIDLGLGVGFAGMANSIVAAIMADGTSAGVDLFVQTLPTLGVVVLGALFGGWIAAMVEKDIAKDIK